MFSVAFHRKGISYLFAHSQIVVVEWIKDDGSGFSYIHLAVLIKYTLVNTDIYDLATEYASIRIVIFQFTFDSHGQFVDQRSIYEVRFCSVNPALANLSVTLLPDTIPT